MRAATPSLRFPGFPDDWKEDRLASFFTSSRAKGKEGMPTLSVTLTRGLVNRDEIDRKTETNLAAHEHLLVRSGDIAYNMMRMWQGAFGRSDREGIVSPAYVVLRPRTSVESRYFEYAFRRPRSIYLFWAYSYGLTNDRLRLYANDFLRIPLSAPTLPEQQKIAAFLTAVDGRIGQLSEKKALLEAYKKGVMQQLFSQTLRFKDDDGNEFPEWVERRAQNFFVLQRGFDLTKKQASNGTYPVYSSSGISYYNNEFKVRGPGVVTGRKGSVGPVFYVEGDFWPHDTSLWIKDFCGNSVEYVYHFLVWFDLSKYDEASSVPTLNRNNVHRVVVAFPSLPEQTKIAAFLTALDRKIEAVSTQIDLTRTFKKGLLQQMFV
jgi:type I restriction enzyme, S subunit